MRKWVGGGGHHRTDTQTDRQTDRQIVDELRSNHTMHKQTNATHARTHARTHVDDLLTLLATHFKSINDLLQSINYFDDFVR